MMKRFLILFHFTFLTGIIPGRVFSQRKIPEIMKATNSSFNMPKGWNIIDNSWIFADSNRIFYSRFHTSFSIYNKSKDMYIFFTDQYIRSGYKRHSDLAANRFFLSAEYLKLDHKIPVREKLISWERMRSANVDTVVSFKIPLDTPVFGKYHYAKQFVLHKQDIANWELTFVARSKESEKAINQAFKDTWGMIRFKADSAFHPTSHTSSLVGKFRYLRPKLNTKDSLANIRNRKRMNFTISMFNGNAAAKTKKYKIAKSNYLEAHNLIPQAYAPFMKIFSMYLDNGRTDSATAYWEELNEEYLPSHPKISKDLKYGLVMLYEKKSMYDSAIVVCKQILEITSTDLHGYSALATMYKKKANFNKAIKILKEAEGLATKRNKQSYFNYQIGCCYEQLSDKKRAKKYFKKAEKKGYNLPEDVKEKYGL